MRRKKLKEEEFYHLINHGPCVLITSGSLNRKEINVAPIAWSTPLNDDPPLVIICVASSHYTSFLIEKYKEFVINVVGEKLLKAIKICGSISGKNINKFQKANLTPQKSKCVNTPFLKESIGHIECKLYKKEIFSGVNLYIGKVVHCEVLENFYDKYLITEKAKTPHHVGGNLFFLSGKRKKLLTNL
ncbi:MAG: flavin reductase family protein [Endomicrobiia bacterium]